MNTQSQNTLKILQLLLRCGMVCGEELKVVLEMMPAVPESRSVAAEKHGMARRQRRQAPDPPPRQNTPALEFDPGL